MARIVVYTHAFDTFYMRQRRWPPIVALYLIHGVLQELGSLGHSWRLVRGPKQASGDVALLHVDGTIVEDAYLERAQDFACALNFKTGDISKRRISRALVAKGDGWTGPVLVKSNWNCAGVAEERHNLIARDRGLPAPHPAAVGKERYEVFDTPEAAPPEVWDDPNLVVERFLPERDPEGYVLRTWVFMGERGSSVRHVSKDPIVKGGNIFKSEHVEVPEGLRRIREELGFDYGKFDYVMHDGAPLLLDANRTPSTSGLSREIIKRVSKLLAPGLDAMIAQSA